MLLVLLLWSWGWTYAIYRHALARAILDHPNERSSHTLPTPRGGGLAIVVSVYSALGVMWYEQHIDSSFALALVGALPLVLISWLDDLYTLSSRLRLGVQALSVLWALLALGAPWYYWPLGLAMLWLINLYNFLDGIDGYAASEAIVVAGGMLWLFGIDFGWIIIASTSGFLFWNWQRAKIFMGDVGSTFLGFVFALCALDTLMHHHASLPAWMVLLGMFWVDATLTLYRRWRNHEPLTQAHRKHAYQRLVQSGWSHQRVVISAMLINIIAFIPLHFLSEGAQWGYLILYLGVLYSLIRYIDNRHPFG